MNDGVWIETFTGKPFHLLAPQPEDICIEDIAHSLSQQCRYIGHTKVFYSVAEHSYFVSLLAKEPLWGLLHDASEAYLSDLSRPAKHLTPIGKPYLEVEAVIMRAICDVFGLPLDMPSSVKEADVTMLYTEKDQLMTGLSWSGSNIEGMGFDRGVKPETFKLPAWSPLQAEQQFLARFKELTYELRD